MTQQMDYFKPIESREPLTETLKKINVLNEILNFNLVWKWQEGVCYIRIPQKKYSRLLQSIVELTDSNYYISRPGIRIDGKYYYRASEWTQHCLSFDDEWREHMWQKLVEALKR